MRLLFLLLVLVAASVGLLWAGHFGWGPVIITNEYEYKVILTMGTPQRDALVEPGLWWHVPLVESVQTLEKRLQYLDAEPMELLIGNETLVVDYYAIWRIINPLTFLRSYPAGMRDAAMAIQRRLKSEVGATIARLPLEEVLARSMVLGEIDAEVSAALAEKGIEVVDVRINRTELPRGAEGAVYKQMREQRRAISREHRAKGERDAREIRAKAEREARTLLAEARSKAEITRGEGDAQSAAIYAAAYGKDPEFYAFLRSLQAYRATLGQRTTMVLPPDHDFFKFLDPGTGTRGAEVRTPAPGAEASSTPAPVSTVGP